MKLPLVRLSEVSWAEERNAAASTANVLSSLASLPVNPAARGSGPAAQLGGFALSLSWLTQNALGDVGKAISMVRTVLPSSLDVVLAAVGAAVAAVCDLC